MLAVTIAVACLLPVGVTAADASQEDTYEWALPAWRATWSAPRLADDRGFAVRATPDAVYVAGVTGSHTVGAGDLFLLRYAHSGELVWSRTWGGFELDQAQGITVAEDGVWVVGSGTTDEAEVFSVLLRFSFDGELTAERTFRRGVVDVLQAVTVHDGDVYVAGLTHPTRPDRNLYAARLSSDLDVVWEIEYGDGEWDEAWDLDVDESGVFVAGYATPGDAGTSEALLLGLTHQGDVASETLWGGDGNDEARAIALSPDGIYVTGGAQSGRSTDVFVALASRTGEIAWSTTTGGTVTGGGGYGVAVGERGIYVAGGNYDFPAGGDGAILRFSHTGALEWSQIFGYPAFWDWSFDVDALDGRFYVAGVLWKPGAEWYEILTLAYDEDFQTTSLEEVASLASAGDTDGAEARMRHFWPGDFLRWAQERESGTRSSSDNRSYVYWEGASESGKRYGVIWVDTDREEPVGQDGAVEAFTGLTEDVQSGNYALVRDYTGVRASVADGAIRFRYYISHDRLIPQGGYLYVGDVGIPLPPPPV